jgi:hypothetical protein
MAVRHPAAKLVKHEVKKGAISAPLLRDGSSYRFGGLLFVSDGGVEFVSPVCPAPFDDPLLSGFAEGGAAGSGETDGETGAASGFVLGTLLGVESGVKLGLVPGVTLGVGAASGATASGGTVLLGLPLRLSGLVVAFGLVFCVPLGFWDARSSGLTGVGC